MVIRTLSIGLAALAAAVMAGPTSAEAGHEHWFYDSYQAYEHQAYPYGYYQPVPSPRWVSPYPSYVPPPAYQAPRRWFPSATPPRYWFPPTEPPRQWRPSAPPSEVYEARRRVQPPVPRSKPDDLQAEVAASETPASGARQRPADTEIVTGSLAPVTPGPDKRASSREVAAASAPEAAEPARQPAAEAAGRISCEAAAGIIGDFGFTDIRAKQCDGQVYDFEATRDGQGYSIKLSAADGELTEVRRR